MPDRCACCGEIIPEGTMVCIRCMSEAENRPTRKGEGAASDRKSVGKKEKGGLFDWLQRLLSSEFC